jgi:hypothetical protein
MFCRKCQRIPACRQIRRNVAVLLMLLGVSAPGARAAVINVTTTIQKVSTSGGCSLQEAIYSANLRTNSAIDYVNRDGTDHFITTQCAPGTGNDTIVLPARATFSLSRSLADAHNYLGPTATSPASIHPRGIAVERLPTVHETSGLYSLNIARQDSVGRESGYAKEDRGPSGYSE